MTTNEIIASISMIVEACVEISVKTLTRIAKDYGLNDAEALHVAHEIIEAREMAENDMQLAYYFDDIDDCDYIF